MSQSSPSNAPDATTTISVKSLAAVIACVTVFAASSTLTFPLISLLLEQAGESGIRIGINTAMAAFGMLLFAQISPAIMRRVGVAPFLMACLFVTGATLLLMKAMPDYLTWLGLRFVLGAAGAGMFLATEFWIAAKSPPDKRGRIAALYAMTLSLGYALGPSILATVGSAGWAPFLIAVGLCAVATIPLAIAWREAPAASGGGASRPPLKFFLTDPAVVWGIVLFGVIEFGAMALTPVWGVRLGMLESSAVALTIVLALGNLLFQPCVGWAADRYPVRPLLLTCAAASVLVAVLMPALSQSYVALSALFFLWGGMAAGLYTVGLAAMGGRYSGAELASANAALVMGYAVGALIGPTMVGGAMDVIGPHGLAAVLGGSSLIYCGLVLWRLQRG
ncbi:MAG: MFS transporter [Pseudomonadota bacterium]